MMYLTDRQAWIRLFNYYNNVCAPNYLNFVAIKIKVLKDLMSVSIYLDCLALVISVVGAIASFQKSKINLDFL